MQDRLKENREKRGLSMDELSQRIGCSRTSIKVIEVFEDLEIELSELHQGVKKRCFDYFGFIDDKKQTEDEI